MRRRRRRRRRRNEEECLAWLGPGIFMVLEETVLKTFPPPCCLPPTHCQKRGFFVVLRSICCSESRRKSLKKLVDRFQKQFLLSKTVQYGTKGIPMVREFICVKKNPEYFSWVWNELHHPLLFFEATQTFLALSSGTRGHN